MVSSYKTILSHIREDSNLHGNSRDVWPLTRFEHMWQELKDESGWCAVLSVWTPPVTNQSISWLDNASAHTTQCQLLLHLHIDGARFTKWLTPFPLKHRHHTYPTLTGFSTLPYQTPTQPKWFHPFMQYYCYILSLPHFSLSLRRWGKYLDLWGWNHQQYVKYHIMGRFIICTPRQILWGWSCQEKWDGRGIWHAWGKL